MWEKECRIITHKCEKKSIELWDSNSQMWERVSRIMIVTHKCKKKSAESWR